VIAAIFFAAVAILAADPAATMFSEVEIDPAFRDYLTSNPLLMETSGAKIIRLPKGRRVVISVASTTITDGSPQDRLRAEKVCRVKALASVVAEKQGVQVAHAVELKEQSVVVLDGDKESGKSISVLLDITTTRAEGIAKDMPVVGRWKSKDGDIFYIAIGAILDSNGELIQSNE
jgi:hypothetical protein